MGLLRSSRFVVSFVFMHRLVVGSDVGWSGVVSAVVGLFVGYGGVMIVFVVMSLDAVRVVVVKHFGVMAPFILVRLVVVVHLSLVVVVVVVGWNFDVVVVGGLFVRWVDMHV